METKHTPIGDWEIHLDDDLYGMYFIPALMTRGDAAETDEEIEAVRAEEAANQKLLQAAPKLLAACKCAVADFEGILPAYDPEQHHPAWQTIQELKAAIIAAIEES
jgi:hypothetical protein